MSNKANKVYYGEYSLRHWIDLILSKKIVLPPYQRRFVWNLKKIRNLIKSLQEGYFIPPVIIGSFTNSKGEKENIILDGQQRLTSILLLYLGLYPNKDNANQEKGKKKDTKLYSNDLETKENDDEDMLTWRFDRLTKLGTTKIDIKKEIKKNRPEDYDDLLEALNKELKLEQKELDELKNIINELDDPKSVETFFDKSYLGFSFIIPDNSEPSLQKKYYSAIFREINVGGQALLPQESRESFYYLDERLESIFSPKFLEGYKIRANNNEYVNIDFVRYTSMIDEYCKDKNKSGNVVRGYANNFEGYYMEHIYDVLDKKDYNKFIENIEEIKKGLGYLEEIIINIWSKERKFDSIIELDLYLFGLVYHVMIRNKKIQRDKKDYEEINKKITKEYENIKNKNDHTRAPNQLRHLRYRLDQSIEILGEFFNESA